MILNRQHLDQRMPVGIQEAEVLRIKNAAANEVLFTHHGTLDDVSATLLFMSGVRYLERYDPNTRKVEAYKAE